MKVKIDKNILKKLDSIIVEANIKNKNDIFITLKDDEINEYIKENIYSHLNKKNVNKILLKISKWNYASAYFLVCHIFREKLYKIYRDRYGYLVIRRVISLDKSNDVEEEVAMSDELKATMEKKNKKKKKTEEE